MKSLQNKTFPVLYHKAKTGATHQWRVYVEGDTIYTEHGQVDGQLQITPGKKATGKNQGKKNETTAEEQALSEAQSMWKFKLDRKYSETPEEAQEQLFLPMLAHPIEKVKPKDLVFPAHVQPKLDGVRCIASWEGNEIRLMSRSGKPYSVPHVEEALRAALPKGYVFDGELYRHGLTCQTITSLVKRVQPDTLKIAYNVYDIPQVDGDDAMPWEARCQALHEVLSKYGDANERYDHIPTKTIVIPDESFTFKEQILAGVSDAVCPIVRLSTIGVDSYDQVLGCQRLFVENGYEGAMLRLPGAIYEWGQRSRALLKVKTFQDAEFIVTDVEEGQGKMTGCGIFVCRNDLTDALFRATPACPMEERARIFRNKAQYVGKKLTVKFFDRTEDQLPRFPVAKLFRAEEDLV